MGLSLPLTYFSDFNALDLANTDDELTRMLSAPTLYLEQEALDLTMNGAAWDGDFGFNLQLESLVT